MFFDEKGEENTHNTHNMSCFALNVLHLAPSGQSASTCRRETKPAAVLVGVAAGWGAEPGLLRSDTGNRSSRCTVITCVER